MKGHSYDPIAPFYDFFSLALGKPYQNSKSVFLNKMGSGDKILYLGGGTGANLPFILEQIGPKGRIFYMEASAKMIRKGKSRVKPDQLSQIVFLHQSDFSKIPHETYDVVLTQFFLDILSDEEIEKLFQELGQRINSNTKWIFLDFFPITKKKWLVQLMIRFFRWTTGNPRKDLPDYGHYFEYYGWEIEGKKSLQGGFIEAWLLKRGV